MPQTYIESEVLTITTDGSGDGNATTTTTYNGAIWGLDIDYGTADATATVAVSLVGGAADDTDRLLFTTAASNTDGIRMPRKQTTKASDGTDTGTYEALAATGRKLKAVVAGAGSTKTLKIRFVLLI